MKRLLLALAGGLLLSASVCAQMGVTIQRGKATHELREEGFFAAHNRFPFDSKVKVKNNDTGTEIEVTISDRIPISPDRVIDLSFDAWEALELTEDTMITLTYNPPGAAPRNAPEPEEEFAFDEFDDDEAAAISGLSASPALYHLLILDRIRCAPHADIEELKNMELLYKFKHGADGYLVALFTSSGEPVYPLMPDESIILADLITEREATLGEYINSRSFRQHVTHRRVTAELHKIVSGLMSRTPPGMKIIPAMPNPNSGTIYRVQVGAFGEAELADEAELKLRNAGFNAVQETYGSLYRVLAAGIRAADISSALRRLYAAGFTEVWIRE